MSDFRYSVRDRDPVWITHWELSYNDGILRKKRRAGKNRRSTNITAPRRLVVSTPAQRHIAAQRLRKAAERLGAPAADLDMVLDMLGLSGAELTTTYTDKGERRRFVAPCPDCGRPYIQLRTDGCFISHPTGASLPLNDDTRCPGSGEPADKAQKTIQPAASPKPAEPARAVATGTPREDPLPLHTPCQDEDPDLFFPPAYSETYARQIEKAKGVCGRCDLAKACLRYALDNGEDHDGIWGGTTPKERRELAGKAAA